MFKKLSIILKSKTGFSLVEVMVGGAILSGVGLAAAYMFRDQKVAQKRIDFDQDLMLIHTQVAKTLVDAKNCSATFKAYSGAASVGDINSIYRCSGICNDTIDASSVVLEAQPFITEGAWVGGVRDAATGTWISPQIWRVADIQSAASNTTGRHLIRIIYERNPKNGAKRVTKDVFVNLSFRSGFRECFDGKESSINSLQDDLCKSMLGHTAVSVPTTPTKGRGTWWNDTTQQCVLYKDPAGVDTNWGLMSCPTEGDILTGINTTGTVACKKMNEGFDPSIMVNGSPTASGCTANGVFGRVARLIITGGKIEVQCYQP